MGGHLAPAALLGSDGGPVAGTVPWELIPGKTDRGPKIAAVPGVPLGACPEIPAVGRRTGVV